MFDNNAVELERAEEQLEDLKAQLDDAMGAEDMLEQLTERNLTLSEVGAYCQLLEGLAHCLLTQKIEEMHSIIEDLEALKELNDELEENHIETERQMQEEIGALNRSCCPTIYLRFRRLQTSRISSCATRLVVANRSKRALPTTKLLSASSVNLCSAFKGASSLPAS